MQQISFEQACDYLKKASVKGSILGLGRIEELLKKLGDPQDSTPVIHVSGTNGKGSFGAMLTSILHSAGYTVGSFSSPPLTGVRDSFRINCEEVSVTDFAAVMSDIIPICMKMADTPTEFEIQTAAAFEIFRRKKCDFAVVECGMGGDADSTNVISKPLLSVITNVQLDHCHILGSTIAEIAAHKAGIIKPNCPILFGSDNAETLTVIQNRADSLGSELYITDLSRLTVVSADINGTRLDFGDHKDLYLPLLGMYQPQNAANVLTAVDILRNTGICINEDAVRKGLADARWHGRFELLGKDPVIIFDGSHNLDGIRSAAESISRYFGDSKISLLIGIMADKDYAHYADVLGSHIGKAFTVVPDNPRAMDCRKLADLFTSHGIGAEPFEVYSEGADAAYKYAKEHNAPLIALGSLYMYSQFTNAVKKIQNIT